MIKMAVVITCVDSQRLLDECLQYLVDNTSDQSAIVVFDNGSTPPLKTPETVWLYRVEENIGGNAVFHHMLPWLEEHGFEYVAYLHCDMMVREVGWDRRVEAAFEADPDLALCGFVGSNQIDEQGGRGSGTSLNYQGCFYPDFGKATTAEQHGIRMTHIMPAAVLDHCSMIFRVNDLWNIPDQQTHFAPGHFYDRICCAELLVQGKHVAVIGIACDHFSGGISGGMAKQLALYRQWLIHNNLGFTEMTIDQAVYVESERRFLARYRDELALIPCSVDQNYNITHQEFDRQLHRWVGVPYVSPKNASTL